MSTKERKSLVRRLSESLSLDPLPADWAKKSDDEGMPYYVHALTGIATYDRPDVVCPPGWKLAKDADSGVVYFWNVHTHETQPCNLKLPEQGHPARTASSPEPPPLPPSAGPSSSDEAIDVTEAAAPNGTVTGSSRPESAKQPLCSLAAQAQPTAQPPPAAQPQPNSPPSISPLPPPLMPHSLRLRLKPDVLSLITFSPTKNGRSIVVTKVKKHPQLTAVHVDAVLLAINGTLCPSFAADGMALLKKAALGAAVDIEVTQPETDETEEASVRAMSSRSGSQKDKSVKEKVRKGSAPSEPERLHSPSIGLKGSMSGTI